FRATQRTKDLRLAIKEKIFRPGIPPGAFIPEPQFSVEQWRHKAAMARDNYVRVVYAGNLCHPGNRASLVKVTERKFQEAPHGTTTAYLRQSFFLIVRQPEMEYSFLGASDQRHFP